jgi:hypothetical protein
LKPLYKIDASLAADKNIWVRVTYFEGSKNNCDLTESRLHENQLQPAMRIDESGYAFKKDADLYQKAENQTANKIIRFYSVNSYGSIPPNGIYVYTITGGDIFLSPGKSNIFK